MLSKSDIGGLIKRGTFALSVRQPWAALLVLGIKDIENRTWPCPERFIDETILIHTGNQVDENQRAWTDQNISSMVYEMCMDVPGAQDQFEINTGENPEYHDNTVRLGGIVGLVRVTACVQDHNSLWAESNLPGTWHWVMADAMICEFVPCKGALGLFKPEVVL